MSKPSDVYIHACEYLMGIKDYHVPIDGEQWVRGDVANIQDVDGRIHVLMVDATLETPGGEIPLPFVWVEVPQWTAHTGW